MRLLIDFRAGQVFRRRWATSSLTAKYVQDVHFKEAWPRFCLWAQLLSLLMWASRSTTRRYSRSGPRALAAVAIGGERDCQTGFTFAMRVERVRREDHTSHMASLRASLRSVCSSESLAFERSCLKLGKSEKEGPIDTEWQAANLTPSYRLAPPSACR